MGAGKPLLFLIEPTGVDLMKFNPLVIVNDIRSFFPMVFAIVRGKYKMPWTTLLWAIVCFIYFISPIDALPDFLLPLGIADDGAFIIFVLTLLHKDLTHFRQSRLASKNVILDAEVIKTDKENK